MATSPDGPGAPPGPPTEPFEIRLPGLLLRSFTSADVPDVVLVYRDPDVRLWNPLRTDEADEYVAAEALVGGRADWSTRDHLSWAVAEGESGRLVGSVSLHQVDLVQGTGEIGYWTAPWARGRGVATASVAAVTDVGFGLVGLRRIELYHAVENAASCAIALRNGYVLEGVHRQSFVYGDGKPHDEHLHGRLALDPPPPSTG